MHSVLPTMFWYFPATHSEQVEEVVPGATEPTLHAVHDNEDRRSAYMPAAQRSHMVDPAFENIPGTHSRQIS